MGRNLKIVESLKNRCNFVRSMTKPGARAIEGYVFSPSSTVRSSLELLLRSSTLATVSGSLTKPGTRALEGCLLLTTCCMSDAIAEEL